MAGQTPIEEHLAKFMLGLARGDWTRAYNRECLDMWRREYGDKVVSIVESIVRENWKK